METTPSTAAATAESTPAYFKGRLGYLTAEEEKALRDLWKLVLQASGVHPDFPESATAAVVPDMPPTPTTPTTPGDAPKRRWPSLWGAGAARAKTPEPGSAEAEGAEAAGGGSGGDDAQFLRATSKFPSAAALRAALWAGMKLDDPDALLLRFLRARRFVVRDAARMLLDNLHWRSVEMDVDGILAAGDGAAAAAEKSADPAEAKAGRDFLHQLRIGKGIVRGVDRQGRPICTIRAREHFAKTQDFEVLKRWIVYIIETARLGFEEGKDRSTVIFDLTGVGMSNVDLQPVWFIAKAFEANYPEMLNRVIVHKAPGFFPYFFNMIIRQLKEEIREKIDFTNSFADLGTHIEPTTIPEELGGPVAFTYAYAEPAAGENAAMADTAARDAVLAAREALARDWEAATLEWLRVAASSASAPPNGDAAPAATASEVPAAATAPEAAAAAAVAAAPTVVVPEPAVPGSSSSSSRTNNNADEDAVKTVQARRRAIAARLRANYWDLDPYVRARSMWDRLGYLRSDGTLDYFAADKVRPGSGPGGVESAGAAVETGSPVAAQA